MSIRHPWGEPPDSPNELLPPKHVPWRRRCARIGGCVTNPQLDPHRCVYCGAKQ